MPGIDAARASRVIAIAVLGVMSSGIARPAEHPRLAPTLDSRVEQVQGVRMGSAAEFAVTVAPGER